MPEGDRELEALRAAIDELAAADAAEVLAEARAEARAKVRSILTEAIAKALLDHSGAALEDEQGDPARAPTSRRRAQDASASAPAGEPRPGASAAPRPTPKARGASEPASTGTASEPPAADGDRESAGPEPARAPEDGIAAAEAGRGLYVYCVLDPEGLELPHDLEGVVSGSAVSAIAEGEIAALTSEVPLSEFGEEGLRENLNDVTWLEETARAHERVLEAALGQTTVIPMRLCTIYASADSVCEMLRRERAGFADALARLEGRTEWGVKVFVDRSALADAAAERSPEIAALRAEVDALPEGEGYMQRRKLDRLAGEEADVIVDACVDDVHMRLSERATEALLNPLQRPEVSGHSGEMLLNGVYLVDDRDTHSFHATVDELREAHSPLGFEIELTGPWPPYNFVKSSIEAAR